MIFWSFLLWNHSFNRFLSSNLNFFSNKMVFFNINMSLLLFFHDVCHRPVMTCFIIDLLQRVLLPTYYDG